MKARHITHLLLSLALTGPALGFDLQGHRGTRGLSPENTLPAFEKAMRMGVDTLELDVGLSADNVLVISHDPHLNPLIVRDAGMAGRVAIQSFDWRTLRIAQTIAPEIPTAYLSFQNANNDTITSGVWTAGYKIADYPDRLRTVMAALKMPLPTPLRGQ